MGEDGEVPCFLDSSRRTEQSGILVRPEGGQPFLRLQVAQPSRVMHLHLDKMLHEIIGAVLAYIGRIKALCGDAGSGVCGAYAWSTDSFSWHSSPDQVYAGAVTWANGSVTQLSSRQRPQLVFSAADGAADPVPIALLNGVSDGSARTWTMAQAFNTKAAAGSRPHQR